MNQPKYAVFDIDGTLIRWQLYHAVADELARQHFIDGQAFAAIRTARLGWKNRQSGHSFKQYETALVALIDKALLTISVDDLRAACEVVIDRYKDQVYIYTRELVAKLRHEGYLLFALSASQIQIVEMIARYYEFDDFGGSTYEIEHGRFTGQKDVMRRDNKPRFLESLIRKHGATNQGSIGVGDSESDIPMLAAVDHPIAFNPTQELFQHAQASGWNVVIERKNMWYELEVSDGRYTLAQTNA